MSLFIIISKNEPIYEAEFSTGVTTKGDEHVHLNHFIIHSSLDMVEKAMWSTSSMYLKVVDKFGSSQVSAFLTAGNTIFTLLHEGKSEDNIKTFFTEVHELYLKFMMNPFFDFNQTIVSHQFDTRVKNLARRYNI